MSKKRYAIVRVDKLARNFSPCPAGFEEIDNDFVCSYKKSKTLNSIITNCKNCRYGDTKEQLIRKVAQIIERRFARNYRFGILVDEIKRGLAKEIVEFLGVKDE